MSTTATATSQQQQLSDREAQIYDRQIRLWGVESQQRISKSSVLIYGVNGLAAEIAKNIVLAGVGSVHLMDNQTVDYPLLGTNFLIHENHLNHNRALASLQNLQELNPLVKVSAEEASIEEKLSNDAFWSRFSIVFLCNVKLSEQIKVNDICRSRNILFFGAETFGLLATMFQDAISFDYHVKNPTTKETKSFHKDYISLSEALSTNLSSVNRLSKTWIGVQCKCVCVCFVLWPICVSFMIFLILLCLCDPSFIGTKGLKEYMNDKNEKPTPNDTATFTEYKNTVFLPKYNLSSNQLPDSFVQVLCQHAGAELSAICAQVGGIAAQEIIKVISRDAEPIDNYFVYDGVESFIGFVERIYPKK